MLDPQFAFAITGPLVLAGWAGLILSLFVKPVRPLAWTLAQTRAAETLKGELVKAQGSAVLVALDAQFEGRPEMLRVLRPAAVLDARTCPG